MSAVRPQPEADRIDRSSPVPLYHQLEYVLRDDIERGIYEVGELLPSEGEICERYGVSRSVVRQTLANLAHAGLVRTERGRGSFVAERKLHERFVQLAGGLYHDLKRMGFDIRTQVIRQEVVDLPLQAQEFLEAQRGVRIDRVRSVEGRVLAFIRTYLPEGLCPGLEHVDLEDRSLYEVLEAEYGLRVHSGRRTVEAVAARGEVAESLGVKPGMPLLLLRSGSRGAQGEPLEWFEAWHRADRTMFEIEIVPDESDRPFHSVVRAEPESAPRPQRARPQTARRTAGHRPAAVAAMERTRMVAVLRAARYAEPAALAEALVGAGVPVLEFTLTGDNAFEAIAAASRVDGAVVGAGSVLDADMARAAVDAGAHFLVAPVGAVAVVDASGDVPVILAGFTPTEVWEAWQATGNPVKVFPASVAGPAYLKALLAPMPQVPLMPSGGVDLTNVADYLQAGAVAVNVGGSLCPADALERGDADELRRRATALCAKITDAGLDRES